MGTLGTVCLSSAVILIIFRASSSIASQAFACSAALGLSRYLWACSNLIAARSRPFCCLSAHSGERVSYSSSCHWHWSGIFAYAKAVLPCFCCNVSSFCFSVCNFVPTAASRVQSILVSGALFVSAFGPSKNELNCAAGVRILGTLSTTDENLLDRSAICR